ncbi:hypothetical protein ACFY5D_16095 [Paeniglutamicibacter sp. NPDC012692]|uniref:hypothetical protein n=1 Tax=Paeniglutamicibacter sp. NPDC012692 TaxID=3364388 RepID=UPI003686B8FE
MSSPTIDVFELSGRATVRSSDGTFLRVQTPTGAPAPVTDALRSQIKEQLEARSAQGMQPRPGRDSLALLAPDVGWEPIASALTGLDVQHVTKPEIPEQSHGLVVQVATTRAERIELDALPATGTAVLRCYREGEILFADPLALCPSDPTGSQVIRRRLAASVASVELDGWLNAARPADATLDGLPLLAAQFLAVRVRAVAAAWQHDTRELPKLRRTLWRLDTRTLCSSEHPVLGFAEPAKRPGPTR